MEVIGKIKVIEKPQSFGSNNFTKLDYVVTTDEQYPQDIKIELHQDKCDLIKSYNVGDNIKTSINLRGREWINPQGEAKYFNSIVGWRIEKVETAPNVDLPPAIEDKSLTEVEKDLPF